MMHARCLPVALFVAQSFALSCAAVAADPPLTTPWTSAESSRVRLVAGRFETRLLAGIEIEMAEGWKTYWRNPGSSGVPPRLDWSKSTNLADARVLFPAPKRFVDRDGDTIGYKGAVVLPIELAARDASKPVQLVVTTEYGICKDICIPVELRLVLEVPPDAEAVPRESRLAHALERVPRPAADRGANDPVITRVTSQLSGDKPRIRIEAAFPGGVQGADLFIEPPDGLWVPLPRKLADASATAAKFSASAGKFPASAAIFEIDLTDGVDVRELAGKTLRATLVSDAGQSEAAFKVE